MKTATATAKALDTVTERRAEVTIKPPNFQRAVFSVHGITPLVIHRFSLKVKGGIRGRMEGGKTAGSKKVREPKDFNEAYNDARYRSKEGWDGFHAASIRNAMIACCRLVGYQMVLAKLSIFCEEDGWDAEEPQIPLVRIIGNPVQQEDMTRVATGAPQVTVRPAYHNWKANIKIRWDADQFTLVDVTNLLARVGMQAGIGEGRPFSKESCGMGWGLFEIEKTSNGNGSKNHR